MTISAVDTCIVFAYMAAVTVFGAWIGRRSHSAADYLLGDRQMPWWAVLGSIVATETSTVTFLSVPGLAFAANGNLSFLQLVFGFVLGRIIISIVLLPQYFRGELFTAYQLLQQRFGTTTQRAASLLFLVTRNLGDGLRLFLTAIVLQKVAGLSLPICILVVGVATIAYTFLGGMKAVIWNDCIQFVVYIGGGVAALLLILQRLDGGWSEFVTWASARNKFQVFDFSTSLTTAFTFWAGIIGGTTLTLGTHGTDQMMVQRYLCTSSARNASKALVLSGVVVFVQFLLFLILGAALACFYAAEHPDMTFESNDQVFATFIVQELPIGMVGLTLAAVFSAAMSTLSSSLSSSATAVVNDFFAASHTDAARVAASRWATIVFGLVQIMIGIGASFWSANVVSDALAIAGFSAGILLGVFVLGRSHRRLPETAVVWSMVGTVLLLLLVHFTKVTAWPWYAPIGAASTITLGNLFALVISRNDDVSESEVPSPSSNEKQP
jgi:SSS family solute:Na+ symporter